MSRKPSRGEVSRRAGRGTVRSTLPQRCLSPPTRKNSRAEMTPCAMLANRAAWMPVSRPGGEGEGDEAHVRHRRVGDQPLEVALDQADQGAPDDADDADHAEDGRQPGEAVGHRGHRQAHQAVGAHLQQHGRQEHRPRGGRGGVGRRQPGVQREHRHLHRQAEHQQRRHEQLAVGGQRGSRAGGERPQVGGARRGDQGEDADEHQRGADRRVEDEAVPGVGAGPLVVAVAEPADQHPHGYQDELEGDEEEHGVASSERGERAGLDDEQAAQERRRGAARGHVDPRVGRSRARR